MNTKTSQQSIINDKSYRATMLYHQLINKTDQTGPTVQELMDLLGITTSDIHQARSNILGTTSLISENQEAILQIAAIHVIHTKIDTLIGPEGLAIITILAALEKPKQKWMLEPLTSDKSEIGYEIIQKLHAIRVSHLSLIQRTTKASHLLAHYQSQFPMVKSARQRLEDFTERLQYRSIQPHL